MTILDEILAHKRVEVAAAKRRESAGGARARAPTCVRERRAASARALARGAAPARDRGDQAALAEQGRDPAATSTRSRCARAYADARRRGDLGADRRALLRRLARGARAVRAATVAAAAAQGLHRRRLPDRRGARAGADAVLLIVARARARASCARCASTPRALGLDALVEVHDERGARARARGRRRPDRHQQPRPAHLRRPISAVTERLAPRVAAGRALVVAESGIFTPADVAPARGGGRARRSWSANR